MLPITGRKLYFTIALSFGAYIEFGIVLIDRTRENPRAFTYYIHTYLLSAISKCSAEAAAVMR